MTHRDASHELKPEELSGVNGGYVPGVYAPGPYRDAAIAYFKSCVGSDAFNRAMNSTYGRQHHYVAARAFLSQADWERFVWIEQFGSLDGYLE